MLAVTYLMYGRGLGLESGLGLGLRLALGLGRGHMRMIANTRASVRTLAVI